jgi:hypothetical protein
MTELKIDQKTLSEFSAVGKKPFSFQAQFFLNAFWTEFSDNADVIYTVLWEHMKGAEMRTQGIQYLHQYVEGCDLDFDMSLYVFEQLGKFYDDGKNRSRWGEFKKAIPQEMTALKRKQELRDRVDVNFDGRMCFLELLLYQYGQTVPELMRRPQGTNENLAKAQQALDEVNKQINAYEAEKARLEREGKGSGTRALAAKNQLAQLDASPLSEQLRASLIKAEAAVRKAQRGGGDGNPQGSLWWIGRELEEKKKKYGKRS